MSVLIALAALGLLMLAAYRGYSVILFAPIAALGAVLLTDPGAVAPTFTGLFMEKMVGFVKLYFPVFLLGAVFGKLIELSGFSRSIVAAAIRILGRRHAIPVIAAGVRAADLRRGVAVRGGVRGLSVRRRAVPPERYPQAADPGHRGARRLFLHHGRLAGHAADQNIIPTSFFGTNAWAAPWLGLIGSLFIIAVGLLYLERQRRGAAEGRRVRYRSAERAGNPGRHQPAEPADRYPAVDFGRGIQPWLHPLDPAVVRRQPRADAAGAGCRSIDVARRSPPSGRWKRRWCRVFCWWWCSAFAIFARRLAEGSKTAVGGAILAAMNTASEYGFGAVIAALPGFWCCRRRCRRSSTRC